MARRKKRRNARRSTRRSLRFVLLWLGGCFAVGVGSGALVRQVTSSPPEARREARSTQPRVDPKAAEKRFQAGYGHLQDGRYSEALIEFQRAAALDPTDPRPHHGQGTIYQKLFLLELASESFRKAVDIDPTFLPSQKSLATVLHDRGEHRDAVELLEPLAKQYPKDTYIRGELAINLLGLGDAQRAIPLLESYNEAEGRQAWGYGHLGRALAVAGELERAEAYYREAMAIDPKLTIVQYWLGQLLVATGREEEAKPLLERYRRLRELSSQEQQLRVALLREQNLVGTLVQLARVLHLQGKRSESLATLERARRLAPDDEKLEQLYRKVAGSTAEEGNRASRGDSRRP